MNAMVVARSVQEIGHQSNSVVTVGTFDGVHIGHQAIIREVVRRAQVRGGRSVVITFDPHPRTVIGKGDFRLLTTIGERLERIDKLGVDAALVLEFTYAFSRLTPREFFEDYLVKGVGVREAVIGSDHMFGRDREAGREELNSMGREFGFSTQVVEPVAIAGEVASSSRIRELLLRGDVESVEQILGRPYDLEGTVVHGDGRGMLIGFPTAYIGIRHDRKLLPIDGVYFVGIQIAERQLYGMLNIGVRPTFPSASGRVVEVHIFDVHEDLYDRNIRVSLFRYLRSEKKFASQVALIEQLQADRNACLRYISALQPS